MDIQEELWPRSNKIGKVDRFDCEQHIDVVRDGIGASTGSCAVFGRFSSARDFSNYSNRAGEKCIRTAQGAP